jgi:hypothetical protein
VLYHTQSQWNSVWLGVLCPWQALPTHELTFHLSVLNASSLPMVELSCPLAELTALFTSVGWVPLPQCYQSMPFAIIDGVLRNKAGLPAAQLVATGTQAREGVSGGQDWRCMVGVRVGVVCG